MTLRTDPAIEAHMGTMLTEVRRAVVKSGTVKAVPLSPERAAEMAILWAAAEIWRTRVDGRIGGALAGAGSAITFGALCYAAPRLGDR